MSKWKGPMDYVDVATRIVEFRQQYPDGRLRQKHIEFLRDFAGKDWIVYTAEAWRSSDDPAPAEGTAWEPVPGPTQFTRDSELQNAETAAWGRAMVAALAVDTRKGIASQEEVRNRQQPARDWLADAQKLSDADAVLALYYEAQRAGASQSVLEQVAAVGKGLKEGK